MSQKIDVKKVIKRLKRELNLKYDAELARELGIKRTYLGKRKAKVILLVQFGMQYSIFVISEI